MDDLSEPLKRIYRYLDSLKAVAARHVVPGDVAAELNSIESGIRGYTDQIAESVDYETDDDDDDEQPQTGWHDRYMGPN